MKNHLYLIAHTPPLRDDKHDVPLPRAVTVATITLDPQFLGRLDATKQLEYMAGRLGLNEYEIASSDELRSRGYQLTLPFPVAQS